MDCPEDLYREVQHLAREYSSIRSGFSKWRSFKYKAEKLPDSEISLQNIFEKKYFLIFLPSKNMLQGILHSNIEKRISNKKQTRLFRNKITLRHDKPLSPIRNIEKSIHKTVQIHIFLLLKHHKWFVSIRRLCNSWLWSGF